jgi:hypothetical protein
MLQPRHLRKLSLDPALHPRGQPHLSSASGLVRVGERLYVVADDEHHLAVLDGSAGAALRLLRLFPGDLPQKMKARKAQKPDLETLAVLPPMPGYPSGALLTLGSGSKPTRERGWVIALDSQGLVSTDLAPDAEMRTQLLDLSGLYAPLRDEFADLNIEGALMDGSALRLLQRGNKGDGRNACISFDWAPVCAWLTGARAALPRASSIHYLELGEVQGVPLGVTDATALPGGAWAFSAVAENTDDSYHDGACVGSAIGIVGANGQVLDLHALKAAPKVEGITAVVHGDTLTLTMVTDADDPEIASQLLSVQLPWR